MEVPSSKSLEESFSTTVQQNTTHGHPPDANNVHDEPDERLQSTSSQEQSSSVLSKQLFDNASKLDRPYGSIHHKPKSENSLRQVKLVFLSITICVYEKNYYH